MALDALQVIGQNDRALDREGSMLEGRLEGNAEGGMRGAFPPYGYWLS
jgi:hypothetical protein